MTDPNAFRGPGFRERVERAIRVTEPGVLAVGVPSEVVRRIG